MLIYQVILLLVIGYLFYVAGNKLNYFPLTAVLVITGILLSFVPVFSTLHTSTEVVFNLFLPAILFSSSYQFPWQLDKHNAGIIAVFSTVGVTVFIFLLGFGIYTVSEPFVALSIIGAFLIAAILTPNDPVSIVSSLLSSEESNGASNAIIGDSIVSNSISIVIFSVLLSMYQNGSPFSISNFATPLLLVSIGGICLGILLGWILNKAIHLTHHRQYHVMISILVVYGGFFIAEKIGVSGVLTTVIAGIVLSGETGGNRTENDFRKSLDGFWAIVKPVIVSLACLLVGIQAAEYLVFPGWGLAILAFITLIIVRFFVFGGIFILFANWRKRMKQKKIPLIPVMALSGIEGTVSVLLLLWLETAVPDSSSLVVSLAFAILLLSLLLQSLTVYPLSRWLDSRN